MTFGWTLGWELPYDDHDGIGVTCLRGILPSRACPILRGPVGYTPAPWSRTIRRYTNRPRIPTASAPRNRWGKWENPAAENRAATTLFCLPCRPAGTRAYS